MREGQGTNGARLQFAFQLAPHRAFVILKPLRDFQKSTGPVQHLGAVKFDQGNFGLEIAGIHHKPIHGNIGEGKFGIGLLWAETFVVFAVSCGCKKRLHCYI